MAKRRKLETPSADVLSKMEQEFRGETSGVSPLAPIAQVAAEAASQAPVETAQARADAAQLESYQRKEADGLVLQEIPLEQINPIEIFRDRTVLDKAELDELKFSIAANGLRMPIEVYKLDREGRGRYEYGLISGYRRLLAYQQQFELTEDPKYATIKSIVKAVDNTQASLAAMIEENEVRSNVSHYERGRIAALAAQNGFYTNVEEAVNALYPVASKAKRSKIRSFALVFEELGDLLEYPENLIEKQGLKLASAIRDGQETALRGALGHAVPANAQDEWQVLDAALNGLEAAPTDVKKSRGGRPKSAGTLPHQATTRAGFEISWGQENGAFAIHLKGQGMDRDMLERVVEHVSYLLDKPDN